MKSEMVQQIGLKPAILHSSASPVKTGPRRDASWLHAIDMTTHDPSFLTVHPSTDDLRFNFFKWKIESIKNNLLGLEILISMKSGCGNKVTQQQE